MPKIIFRRRHLIAVSMDIAIIGIIFLLNHMVFSGFDLKILARYAFPLIILTAIYIVSFKVFRFYNNLWRYANMRECLNCVVVCIAAGLLYCTVDYFAFEPLYDNAMFFGNLLMTANVSFALIVYRLAYIEFYRLMRRNRDTGAGRTSDTKKSRLLIVGAGVATTRLLNEFTQSARSRYLPVCAVDDDTEKVNKYILGVKVSGTVEDIPRLVGEYAIEEIIICIPSATPAQKKRIISYCIEAKCKMKILPEIYATLTQPEKLESKLRLVDLDDFLCRDEVSFDKSGVIEFIKGKRVLVTGGGGSIGSELCRQIAEINPKELIILDINENNAYDIQQELLRNYNGRLNMAVEIASVRDGEKMDRLLGQYKPDIVFHTAAHKHVPLMEHNPEEAVKNNVFGTYNVMMSSVKHGVRKFVLISSDKAVNPTNIMGATKRFAEIMIQCMNGSTKTEFVAVRFGNVLGSAGSVIPLFKKQIEAGGPITVTHKDIKRYFMTVTEAVHLVMQAGYMAKSGQIYVLDMGQPVRILDLAEKMIELMGYEKDAIPIVFTGLRPGEKLYEELLMDEEGFDATSHKKIFIGTQGRVSRSEMEDRLGRLEGALRSEDKDEIIRAMQYAVPTYKADNPSPAVKQGGETVYETAGTELGLDNIITA